MKRVNVTYSRTILLCLAGWFIAFSLSGCAVLAIGGVGTAAATVHDRRTAGTVIDDQGIELSAAQAIRQLPNSNNAHVSVTSYNYRVLLTGEVPTQQLGLEAERVVRPLSRVTDVFNELIVAPSAPATSVANDALLTTKVKGSLFQVSRPGFDPTRVKVVTERGIVYLMGLVTEAEAAEVVNVARQVGGVQQVVKYFEYINH